MDGDAVGTPPTGAPPSVPTETAALRARLAEAEASLSQTQQDLLATRASSTAQDAASAAALQVNSSGNGAAPSGSGVEGGTAAGGIAAPPPAPRRDGGPAVRAAVSPNPVRGLGGGDAPLDGDAAADYVNDEEGLGEEPAQDWLAVRAGGGPARGARSQRQQQQQPVDDGAFDDGVDANTTFTADDWIQSFDIPRSVLRADGQPMPFTSCDPVHTTTFTSGSRDEFEARHWYCSLAWSQQIFNDILDARNATGNTQELLEEFLDYLLGATRRVYALGVSLYDYLALRQSEPNLADAFAHADAVPRNSLRGDGARRFLSRVV